jgi:hypothetical protein
MTLDIEKIYFLVKGTQEPTSSTFSTLTDKIQMAFADDLNDGTGEDFADQVYHSTARPLATSANETFDLAGGISDKFGNVLTMATVKMIYIANTSAIATLEVGAAGANPWEGWTGNAGSTITIGPGGMMALYDPSANAMEVTASTGDVLKVENNDGSNAATYDIIIVGASSQTT